MDNFNALSKSAILTKLALDGYFIDLLTLNSFIEKWHIEAIYENEFGIEFFDNNSYEAILSNLKNKYNETKQNLQTETPKQMPEKEEPFIQKPADNLKTTEPAVEVSKSYTEPVIENKEPVQNEDNLEALAERFNHIAEPEPLPEEKQEQTPVIQNQIQKNIEFSDLKSEDDFTESIMPSAMRALMPGPVAPGSNLKVNHDYTPPLPAKEKKVETRVIEEPKISQTEIEAGYEENYETEKLSAGDEMIFDSELTDILEGDFTPDEIEKANKLMGKAAGIQSPITERATTTEAQYKDIQKTPEEPLHDDFSDVSYEPVQESPVEENDEAQKNDSDELDLMQLAQTFAKTLKGTEEKAEPADLDTIFEEPCTESFEDLQEFMETPPQADGGNTENLSAQDIRQLIKDEISRHKSQASVIQTQNADMKEMIREIVKQTTEKMPQNAFKLDISNRTLDMVAKAIAKKIAVQLNEYYKLNIAKQNSKLDLFREKTIELKEKNQALIEENRRLKAQLLETNKNLNSYKPTFFGLFKFVGKKKSRRR